MAAKRTFPKIAGAVAVLLIAGWVTFIPAPREPGYDFVQAWGGPGSGPGQFNDPTGIAVSGNEVFLADFLNNRIQKWKPTQRAT